MKCLKYYMCLQYLRSNIIFKRTKVMKNVTFNFYCYTQNQDREGENGRNGPNLGVLVSLPDPLARRKVHSWPDETNILDLTYDCKHTHPHVQAHTKLHASLLRYNSFNMVYWPSLAFFPSVSSVGMGLTHIHTFLIINKCFALSPYQ